MGFQLPGFEQGRTYAPREIFYSTQNQEWKPGGIILDGTTATPASDGGNGLFPYEIRAGWWVGTYTAAPTKARLCTLTRAVGAGAATATLIVANAGAFVAGDAITVNAVAKVILSINYTTNTITLTTTATWSNNDFVLGTDGSQIPQGVVSEFTKLKNVDNTVAIDKSSKLAIGGELDQGMLLGDTASIIAWVNFSVANMGTNYLKGFKIFLANVRTF